MDPTCSFLGTMGIVCRRGMRMRGLHGKPWNWIRILRERMYT